MKCSFSASLGGTRPHRVLEYDALAVAATPTNSWYREAEKADWESPARVKEKYRSASSVGGNRVVFNMKGNAYRLVIKINYPYRVVYVRFVGTHADYDKIDVAEV